MDKNKHLSVRARIASCALLALVFLAPACSDDDNDDSTPAEATDPVVTYQGNVAYSDGILFDGGTTLGNGTQNFHFTGDVTLAEGTYLLKGWVYIDAGATLRVPAGTVIKGDRQTMAALIVEPGGRCELLGTRTSPVVLTSAEPAGSRRPGDWGGLIICGRARNNQGTQQIEGGPTTIHGGDDDTDDSGIYQYVRVEFAGYPFDTDKEINGITFGSVGSGTTVDHVQVSYSNDDSFEWFGGTVNARYIVAYKGWDDDFDTDNGFSGTVEYALAIRDPRIADTSQSNAFESDNNASGAATTPFTTATFRNVTIVGPATTRNADFTNTADYITAGDLFPGNGSKLGLFQSAMHIRRSSRLNIERTLAIGYPVGLILDGEKGSTVDYARDGAMHLSDIIFAGMTAIGTDRNKEYEDYLYDYATGTADRSQPSFSHTFFLSGAGNRIATEAELNLTDPAATGQNYCPATMLPAATDGTGSYIGAFRDGTDTWLDGWTCFDPQNAEY